VPRPGPILLKEDAEALAAVTGSIPVMTNKPVPAKKIKRNKITKEIMDILALSETGLSFSLICETTL